jgi:hypothetical protein
VSARRHDRVAVTTRLAEAGSVVDGDCGEGTDLAHAMTVGMLVRPMLV